MGQPSLQEDTALLTLPAKLTVNKLRVEGTVRVFPDKFSWVPTIPGSAQPVAHKAAALTGIPVSVPGKGS